MKIAILVSADMSEDNGITIRAKRINKVLKKNHDVTIISAGKQNFDNLFSMILNAIYWNLKLLYQIPREKIDLIYFSSDFLGFFSIFLLSKFMNFKLIFESHGIFSEENIDKNRNNIIVKTCQIIEKFVIKNSDYVIALSVDIYNFYKVYNKNIDLIPVFIDESIELKEKQIMHHNFKSIGLIGPFDMPSNKYYLNFLYKNLDKFNSNLIFVVIGRCSHRINDKRIKYTGYLKSYQDYISQVDDLDLVLIPSKIPTSGPLNKILEAMLCSVPVLTTPAGTSGLDYIQNNENIFICKENNMVYQLNKNIFDEDIMKKVGQNGKMMVYSHHSIKVNKEKLYKIIEQF
ncbi:glycosyltransferase [Methanobacterium sp.]|uniref:glycosyltransferase n=1 Tax=Methanobacterium sp. TaxID=2164 RepID=UPI003C765FFC